MRYFILCCTILLSSNAWSQRDRSEPNAFELGKQAWNNAQDSLALNYFNQALQEDPAWLDAYRYRAYVYQSMDQPEKALLDYLICLNADPGNAELLLEASVIRYKLKQFELAKEGFLTLLKLPRGETGSVYFRRPEYGEGVTGIVTAQSKNNAHLYNYLGLSERGLGNMAMASAYLDSAIMIQADNPDYFANRGEIFRETGQLSKAEEDFNQALRLDPTHSLARYNLAVLVEESGDPQKASAYYSQVIKDNPSSPFAYRHRGYQRLLDGDHTGALDDFTMAITLDPKNPETYVNRGITLETMREYDRALDDYGRAIALKPDLPKAYFNRGNTLYRMKKYAEALNDYNVALIYQQEYGQAYYQRGLTYHYLENDSKACEDLARAVSLGIRQAVKAKQKICASAG